MTAYHLAAPTPGPTSRSTTPTCPSSRGRRTWSSGRGPSPRRWLRTRIEALRNDELKYSTQLKAVLRSIVADDPDAFFVPVRRLEFCPHGKFAKHPKISQVHLKVYAK